MSLDHARAKKEENCLTMTTTATATMQRNGQDFRGHKSSCIKKKKRIQRNPRAPLSGTDDACN